MIKIQILGTGCAKCNKLTENSKQAADELGIEYALEKVTDLNEIMKFGVMLTPALVVNGEIKISGKVESADKIKEYLK